MLICLCSDESNFVSGQTISVGFGVLMRWAMYARPRRKLSGRGRMRRMSVSDCPVRRWHDFEMLSRRAAAFALFACVIFCGGQHAWAEERTPFASMYSDAKLFRDAIALERGPRTPSLPVTGISVPHHILAADLIARGFQVAAGNHYDRIIILSPDHFSRSRRPMATTRRDVQTVFGLVRNDISATEALLAADALFDDSDLFANEHGIAALLPFVRYFFPDARIVPIAISYDASRADCDTAVTLIKELIGPGTLVVQSTDYSHYLPANVAHDRDQETLNIIAAGDADAILDLVQPAHMDSKASQYVQMQLQAESFKSHATVIASRNSAQYTGGTVRTTSYIVTVYTERLPAGSELRYPDQEIFYFGGDTFIGRYFTAPFADKDVAGTIVQAIKATTGGAPLIVNLEGTMLEEPPEGFPVDLHVMYANLAVPILKALNVKVAGLANNHSFDLGSAGYDETRAILRKSSIAPLGHKEIVDVGPFRLLGLNFIGKFDYHGYPVVKDGELEDVCRMLARPPLISLLHWGQEYSDKASAAEYAAAQSLQACGVGMIVGAHPHRAAQRIEAMQGGEYQLTYSLGNLLFDQTASRGSGALLELRAFKQGTFATRLVPIANMFELGAERLQMKGSNPVNLPETNSAGSRGD
jgi:AmmeMemoRadiSam system protein B